MNISQSHFSLPKGLFISVVVHALPLFMVLMLTRTHFVPKRTQTEFLQVELFGMVTGQQVAGEQAAAAVKQQQILAPAPQAAVAAEPEETPPPPAEQKNAPKPVPIHRPKRSSAGSSAPPQRSIVIQEQNGSSGQAQQTIVRREAEGTSPSVTRQYLAELTRLVRTRLIYPLKAKAKGWTGVTLVAFTVSEGGSVVPGSESVRKTSGYAELDQAALNAVRGSVHLPNPPHQMEVVVAVNFLQRS